MDAASSAVCDANRELAAVTAVRYATIREAGSIALVSQILHRCEGGVHKSFVARFRPDGAF
jgi:hypothetical protein